MKWSVAAVMAALGAVIWIWAFPPVCTADSPHGPTIGGVIKIFGC